MKTMIDLSEIFLSPLSSIPDSFIKVVGSGTGLGKSYSCVLSLQKYIDQLKSEGDEKSVLSIYTAPQHNQISFPESVAAALEELSTTIIRVKPISSVALSNIDSEINAYDAVRTLFFNSNGSTTNALFNSLMAAAKTIDAKSKSSQNPTSFQQTLTYISFGKTTIDGILGKLEQNKTYEADADDLNFEARIEAFERQKNYEEQRDKLQDRLKLLADNLQLILLNSYKNLSFYNEINQELSKQSLKEFREVSATFYPFLHYQLSGDKHALMGMTVAKLLTRHHVFSPSLVRGKNFLKWTVRTAAAEDIINDQSEFSIKARDQLNDADALANYTDFHPGCRKLFDAEVHIYLDESDSSKSTISDILHKNLDDRGIIQANGALAKESGSALYEKDHQPLLEKLPNTDIEAYRYLTSGDYDDSIERQVGKDILRKIQDSIIHYVSSTDWDHSGRDTASIQETVNEDIRFIANAMLTAPYCTVEAGIDRSVFEMTSAFGGEMFGFIGSRSIDQFVVTATPSSIRITEPEYLRKDQSFIPLKSLFLLITINWFIFLSFSRRPGGEKADEKLRSRVIEHINNLLNSADSETASHHVESFKKFIRSLYQKNSGGLFSVAKPFRHKRPNEKNDQTYHTECALESIVRSGLLGERNSGVFSPMNVDVDELLGENTEFFNQHPMKVIDIDYGYRRANTIFGMAQVDNQDYMIAQDKSHVVFPIKYRREAAESYLIKLVAGEQRRVCCFLMSATGAYENSHIPAWSMDALQLLAEENDLTFLKMNRDDYAVTAAKQQERGNLKNVGFKSLDDLVGCDFNHIARFVENSCLKKYKDNDEDGVDGIPDSIIYNLLSLSNRHKRRELDNILKGMDFIHNPSDHGHDSSTPRFGLALAQTHQKFSAIVNLFSRWGMKGEDRRYSITNILSNSSGGGASSAGYGIYRLSTLGQGSRFEAKPRDTLIICYSSALDKTLAKIYKEQIRNPHSIEFKLKEFLGMKPEQVLPDASATDFNAMNYFLSNFHDCNVYIVSAYQSAARGINLIVNKETKLLKSQLRKLKNESGTDTKAIKSRFEARDLDFIFMAAPPFYSEIRLNLSGDMGSKASQDRYFANCDRYLHYLEWAARRFHNEPDKRLNNTEIDLMSPIEDPDADEYFNQQHAISIFSSLQQGLGRIERTNAKQNQLVFLCDGVNEVIHNGIESITEGHDDKSVEQLIGAMSVVNANLVHKVINGHIDLPQRSSDNSVISIETQRNRFENLKRESFLKAIQRYREFETPDAVDENTLLEIEFYEAFRSTKIWELGYQTYMTELERVVERMPKGLKRNYKRILKMMFNRYKKPLDDYLSLSGFAIDLDAQYEGKLHATVNPYCTEIEGEYVYPAPWFLPDLEGNYGEYVTELAIAKLTPCNSSIFRLSRTCSEIARKGYELADFFIRSGNQVVAIDAKHYMSLRSQFVGRKEDHDWTLHFNKKLQRNQERLENLEDGVQVKLAAINSALTEQSMSLIKTVGIRCYLINSESNLDSIASQLGGLLAAGGEK